MITLDEFSETVDRLHRELREKDEELERLRAALQRLLNDSMYKDHPEASQMAIDALNH